MIPKNSTHAKRAKTGKRVFETDTTTTLRMDVWVCEKRRDQNRLKYMRCSIQIVFVIDVCLHIYVG